MELITNKRPSVLELLGPTLLSNVDGNLDGVDRDDALAPTSALMNMTAGCKHKQLALYFGASYCPTCAKFTPQLAKIYQEMRRAVAEDVSQFVVVVVVVVVVIGISVICSCLLSDLVYSLSFCFFFLFGFDS